MQELSFTLAEIHADQPHVTTDTVIAMHYRVADFLFRQVAHHMLDLGGRLLVS